MNSSRAILTSGMIIIGLGLVYSIVKDRPKTPVFVGGIGFIFMASLLEMIGPGPARVAVGIAGVATLSTLLVEGPAIFDALKNAQNARPSTGTPTGSGSGSSGSGSSSTHTVTGSGSESAGGAGGHKQ